MDFELTSDQKMIAQNVREYSVDYFMSQLPCFPDLVSDEAGSDNQSRALRSNEWFAEGHDFSVIDPEYPENFSD